MGSLDDSAASVYRYYDANNLLLYVGYTTQRSRRNFQHSADKIWWQFVSRQEVDHYPSIKEARARELDLIRRFRPPFNKQHNPDSEALASAYFELVRSPIGSGRIALIDIMQGNAKQLPCNVFSQVATDVIVSAQPQFGELAAIVDEHLEGSKVFVQNQNVGRIVSVKKSTTALVVQAKLRHEVPQIDGAYLKLRLWKEDKRLEPKIKSLHLSYAMTEDMMVDALATLIEKFSPLLKANPHIIDGLIDRALERRDAVNAVRQFASIGKDAP